MIYIFAIFMLACGYYTLTYGASLWQNGSNKLGSIATVVLAIVGTVTPIVVLIMVNK